MLQLEHRLGVEQVHLALAAPLVLATQFQLAVRTFGGPTWVGRRMAHSDLGGHLVHPDATQSADRAGEVLVDQVAAQPDGLEDLRAGVAGHGGDTHLAHDLQDALACGLDVVLDGLVRVHAAQPVQVVADHVLDALEGEVRVDRASAVADQQCHVMHLTRVTALDDQAHLGALLLADQMVVHCSCQQQRRNGRVDLVAVAVAQHHDARTVVDGLADLQPHGVERTLHGQAATGHAVQTTDLDCGKVGVFDVDDLGQLVVVDDGERQRQLATALGAW